MKKKSIIFVIFLYLSSPGFSGTYQTPDSFPKEKYICAPYSEAPLLYAKSKELKRLSEELIAKGDFKNYSIVYPVYLKAQIAYHLARFTDKQWSNSISYGFSFSFESIFDYQNDFKKIADKLLAFKLPFRVLNDPPHEGFNSAMCSFHIIIAKGDVMIDLLENKDMGRLLPNLFRKKIESIIDKTKDMDFNLTVKLLRKPPYDCKFGIY